MYRLVSQSSAHTSSQVHTKWIKCISQPSQTSDSRVPWIWLEYERNTKPRATKTLSLEKENYALLLPGLIFRRMYIRLLIYLVRNCSEWTFSRTCWGRRKHGRNSEISFQTLSCFPLLITHLKNHYVEQVGYFNPVKNINAHDSLLFHCMIQRGKKGKQKPRLHFRPKVQWSRGKNDPSP